MDGWMDIRRESVIVFLVFFYAGIPNLYQRAGIVV